MRLALLTLVLFSFVSCKKETLIEHAPSLVGTWKHYSGPTSWHIIEVYDNGEGKMQWYTSSELADFTKVRTWYMKDNTMYFGKVALNGEFYEVIEFPAVSGSETIELYDTLKSMKRYMKLDDGYYVEQ